MCQLFETLVKIPQSLSSFRPHAVLTKTRQFLLFEFIKSVSIDTQKNVSIFSRVAFNASDPKKSSDLSVLNQEKLYPFISYLIPAFELDIGLLPKLVGIGIDIRYKIREKIVET